MELHITDAEQARIRSIIRRPRSRKQLYRAEALIALSEGRPIEEVARQCSVGIEEVEAWVEGFSKRRMEFLVDPDAGRPKQDEDERDED